VALAVDWANPSVVALVAAVTALVTSIVSTPLRYAIDKRALRHRLRTEYEYEQRKELRGVIGRFHGRMVDVADTWNTRMENLYEHEADGWLADRDGYYFRSTVYRFLALFSLARRFEREAVYIDARIAEQGDLVFLKYVRALRWTMTDLDLVEGLQVSPHRPDHLFNDQLRGVADVFRPEDEPMPVPVFETALEERKAIEPVALFFDDLRRDEGRLRWDRLVALHLVTCSFLNVIGYDMQRTDDAALAERAQQLVHPEVAANLAAALGRLGLDAEHEASRLLGVLQGTAAVPRSELPSASLAPL
jgi:hypothetical protein